MCEVATAATGTVWWSGLCFRMLTSAQQPPRHATLRRLYSCLRQALCEGVRVAPPKAQRHRWWGPVPSAALRSAVLVRGHPAPRALGSRCVVGCATAAGGGYAGLKSRKSVSHRRSVSAQPAPWWRHVASRRRRTLGLWLRRRESVERRFALYPGPPPRHSLVLLLAEGVVHHGSDHHGQIEKLRRPLGRGRQDAHRFPKGRCG